MCGLGNNNRLVKNRIKLINDLNKVSLVSGKRKRKQIIYFNKYNSYYFKPWIIIFIEKYLKYLNNKELT